MNNSILYAIFIIPMISILSLVMNQSHFLMVLLSLEGLMLSLTLFIPIMLMTSQATNHSTTVLLLTLGACEASLGLSLMVLMSRSHGNDMLNSLSLNKC